jgi:hypothetical protein
VKAEIPYIKGESRLVYEPAPPGAGERWFINDHCFIEDAAGVLHCYRINNPYPPPGKELYSYHPYLGHATSVAPAQAWQRQGFALDDRHGAEYLGAPFVVWLSAQQRYVMLFESKIDGHRALELAYSTDLSCWHRTGIPLLPDLPEAKRDPCILQQDDGSFLIFLCTPSPSGSSITVTRTTDFANFDAPQTCLSIQDGVPWGGTESPFVVHRNSLYYLFFTYAHRHYYETVVCVSDTFERFSTDNLVTTLYGHAAEVFTYRGKTYISSCGPEDGQRLNRHGLYLAELDWIRV